jgi:hypothetical protein
MTTLAQLIAVRKGVLDRTESVQTAIYHQTKRPAEFEGFERTYKPLGDDDTTVFPPESKRVQVTVDDQLAQLAKLLTRAFNLTATMEAANQQARADVVVDGTTLLKDVPVDFLLYLEKQIVRLRNEFATLPTLSPQVDWGTGPDQTGLWRSQVPEVTISGKKDYVNHVKAWPTKEHPNIVPQVDVVQVDRPVGTWTRIGFSGAIPATRKRQILDRLEQLGDAVKKAREKANTVEVTDVDAGTAIFGYLLA